MRLNQSEPEELAKNRKGARSLAFRAITGLALAALVAIGGGNWRARAQTNRFVSPFGDDLSGTNDCSTPDQPCKTIQNAVNQSGSGDFIELAPGTYTENVTVSQSVTIQGDFTLGATVDGNNAGPVFTINGGVNATLSGLTITHGSSFSGGGISALPSASLTVTGCTVTDNQAAGLIGDGGGIFNQGALIVINSTISGNASGEAGGGIENAAGPSSATIVNSTINGNSVLQGMGGGIFNGGGTLNLTNTIIAGSSGGDCVSTGTIGTNSHNLVQDGSCSPALSGDPMLGPLQNNGGPTFTQALLVGSPAIDAGDDTVLGAPFNLSFDQRSFGFPRKACAHVDIGAYEFGSSTPPTVFCPGNISTVTDPGQTTATVSFSVTASDLCDGALTPVCKIGATVITSPHAFPAGTTTVTCSATDTAGLTGTCSFTVTVTALNTCLQDDHTGDTFRFNAQTGAYVYTRCRDGFTLSGTGVVRNSGGLITLTDSKPDRRVSVGYNASTLTGRANITLILASGVFQTISLNQTNPHPTCTCPF